MAVLPDGRNRRVTIPASSFLVSHACSPDGVWLPAIGWATPRSGWRTEARRLRSGRRCVRPGATGPLPFHHRAVSCTSGWVDRFARSGVAVGRGGDAVRRRQPWLAAGGRRGRLTGRQAPADFAEPAFEDFKPFDAWLRAGRVWRKDSVLGARRRRVRSTRLELASGLLMLAALAIMRSARRLPISVRRDKTRRLSVRGGSATAPRSPVQLAVGRRLTTAQSALAGPAIDRIAPGESGVLVGPVH